VSDVAPSGVIYLDTNDNGLIDQAIDWYPAEYDLIVEPVKYAMVRQCDDTSPTICGAAGPSSDLTTRSFFSIIGGRTAQSLAVQLPDLGMPSDGDEPRIVNVCGPECVLTPGSGFLTIDQIVPGGTNSDSFGFALETGAARNGTSSWTIVPRPIPGGLVGSVSLISMAPGNYQLNAFIPAGWTLLTAECQTQGMAGPTRAFPANGPAPVSLFDVVVNPGQSTRCKYTAERRR